MNKAKREAAIAAYQAQLDEYQALLDKDKTTLFAAGELLSSIFVAEEKIRIEDAIKEGKTPEPYTRRPPIGVRLEIGDRYLTAVPGYKAHQDAIPAKPPWREAKEFVPGKLNTSKVYLEALIHSNEVKSHRRRMLEITITEDKLRISGLRLNPEINRQYIAFIVDTLKDLLLNPYKVFAQNSNHCSCCGKTLTDPVSQTRGIGPECIRYFAGIEEELVQIKQKYRDLDADCQV